MLLSRHPATEILTNAKPQSAPAAPSTRVPWHGGWAAVPHTATRSALPNNAYRVLGLLIGHMDLTTCEVHGYSAQRLAKELAWSTRTVERALATLRATGWVNAYPDPAPYRLGWLVYVVRQEEVDTAPSDVSEGYRQGCRGSSDTSDGGVPTEVSVHDQDSYSDSDQKESPTADGASILSEMTGIPSDRSERRHQRRRPADRTDGAPPTALSELPAIVIAPDAPTDVTVTEQLLLDTGFHPSTAHAFSSFEYDAVRGELHKQDLLGWLPHEDRDRRIGMLVMRWRRVRPQEEGRQQLADATESTNHQPLTMDYRSGHEIGARRYAVREDAHAPVQDESESLEQREEEALDPWTEHARRLRPQWTSVQQDALAQSLRHAPNDAAALMMAQVGLGVALRC